LKQMPCRNDQQHNTTMASKACNTLYNTPQVRLAIIIQFVKPVEHEQGVNLLSDYAA